jgi:hypothetical protein
MSIVKYLEQNNPNLYDLLSDLCVLGRLNGNKKYNGVTFIIPSDETINKIDMLSMTELKEAIALSLYHIIDDYIPTINAWKLKKTDIPNGHKKHVETKSFTNKRVTLANGAVLEIDTKFNDLNRKSAVWKVVSGNINFNNNDKPAKYTYALVGSTKPKPTNNNNSRLRRESKRNLNRKNFVKNVLIEYVDALTNGDDDGKFHNPFWTSTINFLESSPERFQKYSGVISKSTYTTFLLLFGEISPISDEINEWLADPDSYHSGKLISEVLEQKLSPFPFPKLEGKFRDAVDLECVVLHETESNFLSPRQPPKQELLNAIKLVSRTLYKGKMKNLSRSILTTLENVRLSDNCINHVNMYDNYQDFKQPVQQSEFPNLE